LLGWNLKLPKYKPQTAQRERRMRERWGTYSQSSSLSNGASMAVSYTASSVVRFSDELIPTGTRYTVNFTNQNGSKIVCFCKPEIAHR